jgi:hypothetical protein
MKKSWLHVLLILITNCAAAQTYPLREKLDLVFSHVDKSQVPTGFLLEYGPRLVPLSVFNGSLTESNKLDIRTWRYVFASLQTSRIYGTNPLPVLSTVNNAISNVEQANPGMLPIAMLYANYNYLRSDATTLNLLNVQNNQLFDVPGRTQSPYSESSVFAASPTKWYAQSGTPSVLFKQ